MAVTLRPHAAQWNGGQAHDVPRLLADLIPAGSLVWDPCAGIGVRFHDQMGVAAGWITLGTEIEPEWALWRPCRIAQDPDGWWTAHSLDLARFLGPRRGQPGLGTLCRDSTTYPDRLTGAMDAVVTSIAFDNRMNDRYVATADHAKGRTRLTVTPTGPVVVPDRFNYAAMLGRLPAPTNAAGARGSTWRALTHRLLVAMCRAVAINRPIAIELKDSDEDGRSWDVDWLIRDATSGLPLAIDRVHTLPVPGSRKGQNGQQRVGYSQLIVFRRLPAPPRPRGLFT